MVAPIILFLAIDQLLQQKPDFETTQILLLKTGVTNSTHFLGRLALQFYCQVPQLINVLTGAQRPVC
jgi:hypothetical protein